MKKKTGWFRGLFDTKNAFPSGRRRHRRRSSWSCRIIARRRCRAGGYRRCSGRRRRRLDTGVRVSAHRCSDKPWDREHPCRK